MRHTPAVAAALLPLLLAGCTTPESPLLPPHIRPVVDKVGFAHQPEQLRWFLARTENLLLDLMDPLEEGPIKVILSPHDDYAYVQDLYPRLFHKVRARVAVLIGVAHKARKFDLADRLLFGDYIAWQAPGGEVPVSPLRDELAAALAPGDHQCHRPLMTGEHSLEGLVPFLQYYSPGIEIVPVLVPAMPLDRMEELARRFAAALGDLMARRGLAWGRDLVLVISSDALHYGDRGWGRDLAPLGAGPEGNRRALARENEIIRECLLGTPRRERIRRLYRALVDAGDYRKYRWTWCGRYSLPFGLLTALELTGEEKPLVNPFCVYTTSTHRPPLPVKEVGLGVTAPADERHWVGYLGMIWQ